jgi:EmrB/QacA subfamily drug resistance transporter
MRRKDTFKNGLERMNQLASAKIADSLSPQPEEKKERFLSAFLHIAPSMFLAAIDQTIIAAALPAIGGSLGGLSYLAWVVTAYLLAATVAAPLYGRMGDAFGRKRMLIWALGLFVAGSAGCAMAPSLPVLVCARALQGFGGGGLMTLAQALIGEVVSPKERGKFQGWFGANFALASTLGPLLGGVLSQHLGWRSIFWINVPLGLAAAVVALRVKTSPGTGVCRLDYAGTGVFVTSTVAFLLALSIGGHEVSWASPVLLALAALGAAGFVLLRTVEQKSRDPLISPQLIGDTVIWRASLTVLLFASVLFGLIVQLPVFFQTALRTSATTSGLLLIPLTLAQVTVSTATGWRISTTGRPRTAMAAGLSVVTAAFFLLATGIKLGPVFIALLTFVIGAGLGSTMPSAQTMVQWAAGEARLGVGTALVSFSRSIGGVFGAAFASAVLLGALQAIDPGARDALTHELASIGSRHVEASQIAPALMRAYRWVFYALGGLSAGAAAIAWSIPNLDLASSPSGAFVAARLGVNSLQRTKTF